MTKTEMLFVRACKSANPSIRLRSVYKRFYLRTGREETDKYIVHLLIKLVEDYFKFSLAKTVEALDANKIFYVEETTYTTRVFRAMLDIIRFTESKDLPADFIKPISFRRGDD